MKILFLSTHNLATNPRLVKEMRLALSAGFLVEVICFEFDNWSKQNNQILKTEFKKVKIIGIPAGRNPLLPWLFSVISEQSHRKFAYFLPASNPGLSKAISRRTGLLINALTKVSKPDWIIGHNPGALYPTLYAAQKFNCRAGFDVEDYHPGEGHDIHSQKLTKKLMQSILPQMDYVSFAAPLIREEMKKDLETEGKNWITVLNYFPAAEFVPPAKMEGPLKLVWFSQNIASGRGLELILDTIKQLSHKVELHLFGHVNHEFHERALKGLHNVILHEPIPQAELHKKLSEFDIGLALEPAKDKNNELAISNKILAYLQAGLYVLATDTPAQQTLLNNYPSNGETFKTSEEAAGTALTQLLKRIETIRSGKETRYQDFKSRNWENESVVLSETWAGIVAAKNPTA